MSELELIHTTLRQTSRRKRWQGAWQGFWKGFLAAAAVWLFALALFKLLPLPPATLTWVALLGGLAVLATTVVGGWRRPTAIQTARWVDQQQHFQERLSTALEVAEAPAPSTTPTRWRELLLTDAAERARQFDCRRSLPWTLPRLARWTALVLALAAGLGFVPEYRTKAHVQKKKDAEIIRETGQQLVELTRRQLELQPPALEPTQKALQSVEELGQQLARAELTKSQALKDLASASDRIKEQLREMGRNPALRRLDRAARTSPAAGAASQDALQKQLDTLQDQLGKHAGQSDALDKLQRDLKNLQQMAAGMAQASSSAEAKAAQEQMSQALADLARKAEELGLDLPGLEDAAQALSDGRIDQMLKDLDVASMDLDKLAKMAKAIKDLKMQMADLGKNLAEQLDKGQAFAAIGTLNKMVQQLRSADLTPEQLQKLLQEVDQAIKPGSEYGKVGEFLKEAAKALQQGEKGDASQSLASASEELKRLMQQLGDCEGLMASLDALQKAGMCVGNGLRWGLCKSGCKPGLQPGGKPGRGVGTWGDDSLMMDPEDTGLWDNSGIDRPDMEGRGLSDRGPGEESDALNPTKVRGQISPGGPMPSITLKGVSIKGESRVQYQEAVQAAQTDAQSALSQDQVPRAYRGAVRDYFDDLKE